MPGVRGPSRSSRKQNQIQLTEEQHRRLKRWAQQRHISLSEAIRRLVSERLEAESGAPTRAMRVREALAVAGACRDPEGRSDVAEEHDEHLAKAHRK